MLIKRLLIGILAGTIRLSCSFGRSLARRLNFLDRPLGFLGQVLFKSVLFPAYRGGYLLKYKILNFYSPAKSKVFYFLNKGYVIHVAMVIFSFILIGNNLNAQELRQTNFGENTVVYSLVTKEVYEDLTEETLVDLPQERILSYLDPTASVSKDQVLASKDQVDENQVLAELSTILEGGSAVVKPNFIQPIKPEEAAQLQDEVERQRTGIQKYVVQSGETVSSIAEKFGISSETILWQNKLGTRDYIRPGQSLEILPVSGIAHRVGRGETLGAIAKKYDVETEKILAYNSLPNLNAISIGQQLIIPGGTAAIPSRYAGSKATPQVASITKLFVPDSKKDVGVGMLWPTSVRRISQYFSWRHTGLDIAGPTGTPLYAAESGTVEYSGWSNGYGNNVVVNHGNGMKTRYAHASKLFVAKGDSVVKGQTLAAMGSTGWSTGPHIHFEVIINGARKNPLSYIQ